MNMQSTSFALALFATLPLLALANSAPTAEKALLSALSHYSCDAHNDITTKNHFQYLRSTTGAALSFDANDTDYDIFARLIVDSGLRSLFTNADAVAKKTVFAPRDLAMKQSAADIQVHYRGRDFVDAYNMSENEAYDIITSFVAAFDAPWKVLQTIVKNHVVNGDVSLCDLLTTIDFKPLSGQNVLRSGVFLVTEKEGYFHPMIYFPIMNVKTKSGYVHSIDRMLMPDLETFAPSETEDFSTKPSPSAEPAE